MLPAGKPHGKGRSVDGIVKEHPELKEFLIDGMEQPVRRPKDEKKQKTAYSGKKKRHTRKNILLTNSKDNFVHFLGKTQNGSVHDKKAADQESLAFTSDIDIGGDLGFEGFEAGNARIILPAKKPKGKELSDIVKSQNKIFSAIRIRVEHAVSGVKRSHIAADIFRNTKPAFADESVLIAAGLHNFRVRHRFKE